MIYRTLLMMVLVFNCANVNLFAAKKKVEKEPKEPPVYYVVEVFDLFGERLLSVSTTAEFRAIEADVKKRNASLSLAYKEVSKGWAEAEKERVEKLREAAAKQKDRSKKLPKAMRQPFVMKPPGLISMKVEGPYEDMAEAASVAEAREVLVQKDLDFIADSAERKVELMSEGARKSHEAKLKLEETQKSLFLEKLESLRGQSAMLAGNGNIKRMGGSIKRLVGNTHRMMKPGASAATATKVDARAVKK